MKELEILLNRRWILKSEDKENIHREIQNVCLKSLEKL